MCRTPIRLSGSERRERKVCTHCGQELAHASYSRHQLDKTGRICLGKGECLSETSEFSRSLMGSDLDSIFDFGSAGGDDCTENNFSDDNEDILNSDDTVRSY